MKLSKTSDLVSTLKDQDFFTFSKTSFKEMSQRLLFPQKTDFADSIMTSLNGFSDNMVRNFCVTKQEKIPPQKENLEKISCLLSQCSPHGTTEKENTTRTKKTEVQIASRKIKIRPTNEQIILFSKCFGATRYFHNKCVDFVNNKEKQKKYFLKKAKKEGCIVLKCNKKLHNRFFCKKHKNNKIKYDIGSDFKKLNKVFIKKIKFLKQDEIWLKEIPYDTKQLALKNFSANYNAALTNTVRKNITGFKMKFISKKSRKQFFHISNKAIKSENKEIYLWRRSLKDSINIPNKKDKKWLLKKIPVMKDFIITREYPSTYYMHVPFEKKKEKIKPVKEFVSIDPGVRTFHTFYDSEGYGKIGDKLAIKINTILKRADKFQSLITKLDESVFKRTRRHLRRRCALLRAKARHIVDDHHWKSCKFYLDNYKTIILPELNTESITRSIKRTMKTNSSKVIRRMMSLSHGKFMERLKYKSGLYEDRRLLIVDESYTSKTCGNCGRINKELGSSEVFNCEKCNKSIDRDVNGARNILLKKLLNIGADDVSNKI